MESPVEVMPGLYEVTQTAGRGAFETFNFCVKASNISDWPHVLTEKLINNTLQYPSSCKITTKKREGNLATTVHLCGEQYDKSGILGVDNIFTSTIHENSVDLERTVKLKMRSGLSKSEAEEVQKAIDADPPWGVDMFTVERKNSC